MTEPPSTNVRWCLGLQSIGVRALTADETATLRRHARAVLGRLLRLLVLLVASPVMLLGSVLLVGDGLQPSWQRMIPAAFLLVAGGFFLPAAALLVARDVLRAWRAVRSDLRAGTIEQFRAAPPADDGETTTPPPTAEDARVHSIDVVPWSRQVLLLNGAPPERPLTAEVYESAPPPGKVALYSLPTAIAEQLPETAAGDGRIDRRRLTPNETVELATLARRMRRGSWAPLAIQAWIAVIGTAGVAGLIKNDDWATRWPSGILFTILLASGIIGLRRMVHRWGLSRVIDEDRKDAWVLVLHGQSKGPSPIEVLPRSLLLWSSAASPSAWRMTSVRGRPTKSST